MISKYRLLKTFVSGETIYFSVNGKDCSGTFVRVDNATLFLENEEIELKNITKIRL